SVHLTDLSLSLVQQCLRLSSSSSIGFRPSFVPNNREARVSRLVSDGSGEISSLLSFEFWLSSQSSLRYSSSPSSISVIASRRRRLSSV
ncbi:hypothetical protein U1Q18_016476, partial [Sarracenia purpurea var. burkii]